MSEPAIKAATKAASKATKVAPAPIKIAAKVAAKKMGSATTAGNTGNRSFNPLNLGLLLIGILLLIAAYKKASVADAASALIRGTMPGESIATVTDTGGNAADTTGNSSEAIATPGERLQAPTAAKRRAARVGVSN